jgi:hypothetical protein
LVPDRLSYVADQQTLSVVLPLELLAAVLERRERIRDVARAQELERGAESVPERKPEDAPHDAVIQRGTQPS